MDNFVNALVQQLPPPPDLVGVRDHDSNAVLLAEEYETNIAHTPQYGWRVRPDHGVWQSEGANELVNALVSNALKLSGVASSGDIDGTIKQLKNRCFVPWKAWDANADVIGLRDGTLVDLATGDVRPVHARDYISQAADVYFDADAKCPKFEQSLREWLPKPEARELVLTFLGYCLTGRTDTHAFLLALGAGRNGKGTLLEVMGSILGDYSMSLPLQALTGSGYSNQGWMVDLRTARLAYIPDLPPSGGWKATLLKTLTGGDAINARKLYKDSFTFKSQAKIVVGANNKPRLSGDDKALKARMRLVEFPNSFEGRENRGLLGELLAERAGIFNLLVSYAGKYIASGLPELDAETLEAKDAYFEISDRYAEFIETRFDKDPDGAVSNREIRKEWVEYQHDITGNEKGTVYTNLAEIVEQMERHGGKAVNRPKTIKGGRGVIGFKVANFA